MRVTIVAPWGERLGGAEQVLATMLQSLEHDRVEPAVVFLRPGPFVDEVASSGISTHVVPEGRLRHAARTARVVRGIAEILRAERADVVLNWSAKAQIYGSPAAGLAGLRRRVVWWQHAIPAGHWIDRLATALPASTIVCCSTAAADAQRRLLPRRSTVVVHAGVGQPPRVLDRTELRRELGIPDGQLVVGVLGRLQPWKGQHLVVHAIAKLVRRGLPVHGLVIGGAAFGLSPGYEPELHALARSEGVGERVTFTGQVPDGARYLSAVDVLVNASRPEPYGLVLLEAMQAGIPTVAFAEGGPADIVADGVTGVLVDPSEPDALTAALESLLRDPERMRAMGAAGRQRVELFSPAAAARALEDVLAAALRRSADR